MVVRLNTTLRNAMANAVPTGGSLSLRTGGQPTSGDAATQGTLLVTIENVGFVTSTSGTRALAGPTSGVATSPGTAGWARYTDGSLVLDGTVGTLGSGADFIISATTVAVGDVITVQSMNLTMPG
jgi:hypothetical protein